MNITLSADEKLIINARQYANKHNTTLNALIRDYLKKLINNPHLKYSAEEFEMIALNYGGVSNIENNKKIPSKKTQK
jgi:hypothetical protein